MIATASTGRSTLAIPQTQFMTTSQILIVDDNENNRLVLSDHLQLLGFESVDAIHGRDALDKMQQFTPQLILLDLDMPVMNGHELLAILTSDPRFQNIPVVIISGSDDTSTIAECIRRGAADFLVKPFQPRILSARIDNCLAKRKLHERELALRRMIEKYNCELEEQVAAQVRQLGEANVCTIFALSTLAESRDPETGAHLERIRNYCRVLAEQLAKHRAYSDLLTEEYIHMLYVASPLHDIGKVGIPDDVLLKPGRLTEEEFSVMQRHCDIGASCLERVSREYPDNSFMHMGVDIARYHHEKWDGTGYPNNLKGEEIPVSCRILALADVYDALRSKRCYKDGFSHEKSREIILEGRGKHFDPDVVEAFLAVEQTFVDVSNQYSD